MYIAVVARTCYPRTHEGGLGQEDGYQFPRSLDCTVRPRLLSCGVTLHTKRTVGKGKYRGSPRELAARTPRREVNQDYGETPCLSFPVCKTGLPPITSDCNVSFSQ